jgi:putative hydrolase of the HAD superfamily
MNQYLEKTLKLSWEEVDQIRTNYIKQYGTTLLGMMIHHHINPDKFLQEIHSFDVGKFLKKEPALLEFLQNLSGKKYIFTNSPQFYARNVLKILGIDSLFEDVFSIETVNYHGKPNMDAYQKVIEILHTKEQIAFVDDEPANVIQAKKANMKTFLVDSRRKDFNNYYEEELFPKLKGMK